MSEDSKLVRILSKVGKDRALSGIRAAVGTLWGTIDCTVLGGIPVFTTGMIFVDHLKMAQIADAKKYGFCDSEVSFKEYYKGLATYALGASIPFIMRYHKEIAELTDKLFY